MGPAVKGRLRLGVQMIRSKSVYNKLDLETYNKYNIEKKIAAIEIMGKDNKHHPRSKTSTTSSTSRPGTSKTSKTTPPSKSLTRTTDTTHPPSHPPHPPTPPSPYTHVR